MVKHTQTICREQPINCFSVFDHFVGLVLKVLRIVIGRDFFSDCKNRLWFLQCDKRNKGATNPKTIDNKCFRDSIVASLNHEIIPNHPERISNLEPFLINIIGRE